MTILALLVVRLGVADMRYEANCLNRAISNSQSLFHTGIKRRLRLQQHYRYAR
jgi:hypothetical protein